MPESENPIHGAGGRAATRVRDLAADWLSRRDAGLSRPEHEELNRWLAASAAHATVFAEVEAAWSVINQPRERGAAERVIAELEGRARLRRRRRMIGAFATVGLGLAAALVLTLRPVARPPVVEPAMAQVTIVPRPERQTLSDGSVVELNAGAEIAVDFSPAFRRVKLVRGEAHFAVAKNPARPFIVSAGLVEVRAVGTQFAVELAPAQVEVFVTEGRVAIGNTAVPASVGDRATVALAGGVPSEPHVERIPSAAMARALSWRDKRVEFSGTPLAQAVALFNAQNTLQLTLQSETLGSLRVSGIFWSDNPEGFARLLESSFGLQARRVADDRIELSK